jgi:DNA-binding NarL/FixJ family response regulator
LRTDTDGYASARAYGRSVHDAPAQSDDRITVLVADRHDLVRRALRDLIDVEPGFAVVAEAVNGVTAEAELRRRQPGLLLVEPAVLGSGALLRLPALLRLSPPTRAVVLADESSPALDRYALGFGAVATVVKHAPPDELFDVLRHAMTLPLSAAPLSSSGC